MSNHPQHPTSELSRSGQAIQLLLTEEQAAAALGFTKRFLQSRRYAGGGPRYVKVSSRAIRYRPEDLAAWAESRLRTSTSDPGQEAK